jgi:hypothetical protein
MLSKHCSEEQLLAYLDGELGPFSRYRCARHLRKCWACREQLGAVQRQTELLARLARLEQSRFSPEAAAAKRRFLAWVASEQALPAPSVRFIAWPRLAACLALGALACAAGIGYWRHASGSISVVETPAAVTAPARPWQTPAPAGKTEASAAPRLEPIEPQPQGPKRWSPESLAEAELEATAVLCAHSPESLAAFTLERDPVRGLRIEGIVEDQSRKDILLSGFNAAIRSAPWSANLAVAAQFRPAVLPDAAAPEHTVRARSSPAETWLREALPSPGAAGAAAQRVNAIVNGALRRAGTAATAAWTLRRLVERFPDSTAASLSPRGREMLSRIAAAQLDRLREAVAAERQWIGEQFPDAPPVPVTQIFDAVSGWERLVHRLMTCCDDPPADTRAAMRDLAALLNGIDKHLSSGDFIARHWPALAAQHWSHAHPLSK